VNSKYKFLIAGGINSAVTFALYALLIHQGVNYNLALTVTYALGIVLGFFINRLWTFTHNDNLAQAKKTKPTSIMFIQYLVVYLMLFSVNFLLLNLLVKVFNFNPIFGQFFAVVASTICSYFLQRSWVFKG